MFASVREEPAQCVHRSCPSVSSRVRLFSRLDSTRLDSIRLNSSRLATPRLASPFPATQPFGSPRCSPEPPTLQLSATSPCSLLLTPYALHHSSSLHESLYLASPHRDSTRLVSFRLASPRLASSHLASPRLASANSAPPRLSSSYPENRPVSVLRLHSSLLCFSRDYSRGSYVGATVPRSLLSVPNHRNTPQRSNNTSSFLLRSIDARQIRNNVCIYIEREKEREGIHTGACVYVL